MQQIKQDVSEKDLAELRAFVDSSAWRFASTMPQVPHWYTLRKYAHDEERFLWFVQFIRTHGYSKKWNGTPRRYIDLDGWMYWTMGAPLDITILINRAKPEQYHTGLLGGVFVTQAVPPVERVEVNGSVALVHDVVTAGLLPSEYDACDVLYAEPPWEQGLKSFDEGAGVEPRTFDELSAAMAAVVERATVPVVLLLGKKALTKLPPPQQTLAAKLNGAAVIAAIWNTEFDSAIDLAYLATRYNRVGDFMCGYGRSGRVFAEAGKRFTLSDYNATCIGYIAMNANGWHP